MHKHALTYTLATQVPVVPVVSTAPSRTFAGYVLRVRKDMYTRIHTLHIHACNPGACSACGQQQRPVELLQITCRGSEKTCTHAYTHITHARLQPRCLWCLWSAQRPMEPSPPRPRLWRCPSSKRTLCTRPRCSSPCLAGAAMGVLLVQRWDEVRVQSVWCIRW
jgi:hypothetical protein